MARTCGHGETPGNCALCRQEAVLAQRRVTSQGEGGARGPAKTRQSAEHQPRRGGTQNKGGRQ